METNGGKYLKKDFFVHKNGEKEVFGNTFFLSQSKEEKLL
jgi:hypothetical protein